MRTNVAEPCGLCNIFSDCTETLRFFFLGSRKLELLNNQSSTTEFTLPGKFLVYTFQIAHSLKATNVPLSPPRFLLPQAMLCWPRAMSTSSRLWKLSLPSRPMQMHSALCPFFGESKSLTIASRILELSFPNLDGRELPKMPGSGWRGLCHRQGEMGEPWASHLHT